MKQRILVCILVFLKFFVTPLQAQNEAKKWYFGNYAGLDFTTNPPTALTNSSMTATGGCASIADAAGNLLFYTNGASVWDRTHALMANGTGLAGINGGAQTSIIIKQPGNTNIYFIFTNDLVVNNGTQYSVVDMNLASGNGSVTVKNASLSSTGAGYTQKLTATKHCNGTDIWVLTRSGYYAANNQTATPTFYAYLVTAAGVNTTAVTSPANNPWAGQNVGYYDYGCMKVSPNGKKIGLAAYGYYWNNNQNNYAFELYNFNASTGAVTNSLGLQAWNSNSVNIGNYSYGCEFSPDGTKFYGSSPYNNFNYATAGIMQWDLCAGSDSAVQASSYTVATVANNNNVNNQIGTLQLGPNGKVYAAIWGQSSLGVINNPNIAGAGCNYVSNGQSIAPRTSYWGLPNFMTTYLSQPQQSAPFTYTVNQAISCLTATFTSPSPTVACPVAGYSVTNRLWLFGDPGSGAANTSTLNNPTHTYPTPGTYTVKLVYNYSCGSDTITQPVSIIGASLSITTASITCATLGSATVIASGGVGPYTYTWMPTAQSSSVATGLIPGNYSITVKDNGGSCIFTATTSFAPLVPFTGVVVNSPSITCYGGSTGTASISLNGGSGNQYYYWTDANGTQTVVSPSNLAAGINTVSVIDALTSCSVTQYFQITQPPALTLNIASSSPTTCVGGSIIFTASNSGGTPGPGAGYTYTWTSGPSTNTNIASPPFAGSAVYTVSSSDSYNCKNSQTVSIQAIPNPTVSVSSVSICPLQTGTLTATGASTYSWNNTSTLTGASFTDAPMATSVYTVVGTALGCTSTPVTASIVLKPVPSPTITSNSPVCNGQALTVSGSGGVSYLWDGPLSFTANTQNASVSPSNPNNSGAYGMTVTAANNCTAATSATLTVHPTPTLSAAGSTVCVNQTLSLTANSFAGATYTWSGPNSFVSSVQNPTLLNPPVVASGIYTVAVASAQGCTNVATASASVVAMPVPVIVPSYTALCSGLNLILSGSGGANYNWSGPNSYASSLQSNTIAAISTAATGVYTLTVTTGPCTAITSQSITVYPLPTPTATSPAVCEGATLQLSSSGGGANTFAWSGPNGFSSGQQNPFIAPAQPGNAGTYSLTVTDGNGCQSSITTLATVMPNPTVSATGTTVCLGSPAILTANGALTYAWSNASGYSASSATAAIAAASSVAPELYVVIGTAPNSCTAMATAVLQTMGLPVPALTVTPRSCLNSTISLQASGGVAYMWAGPYAFYSMKQNDVLTVSNIQYAGTYSLTAFNSAGCSATITTNVVVDPIPEGDLASDVSNYCIPYCANFSLKPKNSAAVTSTSWQVDGVNFPQSSFRYCVTRPGNYVVKGSFVNDLGCANTATYAIPAYELPVADFAYNPEHPVEGIDNVAFTNMSEGNGIKKFNWYFISNSGNKASGPQTNYTFQQAGTYPISLVVTNAWGCSDTIVKSITVDPDFEIYVPNAFTPNDDDKNDVFMPKGSGIASYHLAIYDRWGARIFESSEFNKGWDGRFKGQDCQTAVYVWKITVSDHYGKTKNMNGFVTLYR